VTITQQRFYDRMTLLMMEGQKHIRAAADFNRDGEFVKGQEELDNLQRCQAKQRNLWERMGKGLVT
jgi:hypothetical protein